MAVLSHLVNPPAVAKSTPPRDLCRVGVQIAGNHPAATLRDSAQFRDRNPDRGHRRQSKRADHDVDRFVRHGQPPRIRHRQRSGKPFLLPCPAQHCLAAVDTEARRPLPPSSRHPAARATAHIQNTFPCQGSQLTQKNALLQRQHRVGVVVVGFRPQAIALRRLDDRSRRCHHGLRYRLSRRGFLRSTKRWAQRSSTGNPYTPSE